MTLMFDLIIASLGDRQYKLTSIPKTGSKVSLFGGWCKEAGTKDSGEHRTDTKLLRYLTTFFKGFNALLTE